MYERMGLKNLLTGTSDESLFHLLSIAKRNDPNGGAAIQAELDRRGLKLPENPQHGTPSLGLELARELFDGPARLARTSFLVSIAALAVAGTIKGCRESDSSIDAESGSTSANALLNTKN